MEVLYLSSAFQPNGDFYPTLNTHPVDKTNTVCVKVQFQLRYIPSVVVWEEREKGEMVASFAT